ncbi:MAG TPA: ATP-binding protein [Gemmatimonadaceae bacterium]|nr:ATP-binding protein [Gemmatimonadaceae bacterium]
MDELIEQMPCGFLSFTDDGKIERVNARLLERLGYQRAEVEGKPFESIMNVGSRIFYQTHLFPLLAMNGRADEIFILLRASDGNDVGFLLNAARRERNGHKVNDCALMRLEERRKFEDALVRARNAAEAAQKELELANRRYEEQAVELELQQEELEKARSTAEKANKAKSKFLAVMSHELRTPLNAIGGYTQLLEMGVHGPVTDDQLKALDRISRSQKHLLRLINDVLNLSRIESGREEYRITEVPLGDVVSGVLPMIEPQLAAKRITSRTLIDGPYVVRSDREKLEQIVLNLLTNATKFTPAGGGITVRVRQDVERERHICLDVEDTGIGISPEKQKDVFEPFVQVHADRKKEGSGLGLAISRELARGMDADLTVKSEPGKGSVFTVTLPVVKSP